MFATYALTGWGDFGLALLAFVMLGTALWGLGKLAALLLQLELPRDVDEFGHIWIGLATALFVLTLIHYLLPITHLIGGVLYGIGIVYALFTLWRRGRVKVGLGVALFMVTISVWLASRALLPPTSSDSGLYYFATIRWINEYPLVPGLGNLHGRFAFNQSLFLWIASLNLGPWSGHGFALANSFLCLVVAGEGAQQVVRNLQNDRPPMRLTWAVPMLLLPPVLSIMLTKPLASAAPDVTSELLQLAIFVWYVRLVATVNDADRLVGSVCLLIVLCALALTVKLSNAAFIAGIGTGTLFLALRRLDKGWTQIGRVLLLAALLVGGWFGRGLLLSGCPLYPSTLLCQDFPWGVSIAQAKVEAFWVYSWARQPGIHYDQVLGSWNWLGPWAERMADARVSLLYPAVLAGIGVCCVTWVWLRQDRVTRRSMVRLWAYLLPPIMLGLTVWFLTAPELRFAQGLIWLLPVAIWIPLLIATSFQTWGRKGVWGLWVLVNGPLVVSLVFHSTTLTFQPWKGFASIPTATLVQQTTDSGLVVYTPAEGYHCWDGPLPCTPYFNPGLRLLGEGLGSGFSLDPAESAAPRWEE